MAESKGKVDQNQTIGGTGNPKGSAATHPSLAATNIMTTDSQWYLKGTKPASKPAGK